MYTVVRRVNVSSPLVNVIDSEYVSWGHGDRFEAKPGTLSSAIRAKQPGINVTSLAQFSFKGNGKPTAMRYIIRSQAGKADHWQGE